MSLLQFSPFATSIDPAFWHELTERKIGEYKLDTSARPLFGTARLAHGASSGGEDAMRNSVRFHLDSGAFGAVPPGGWAMRGALHNRNTVEDFRTLDKAAFLAREGAELWSAMRDSAVLLAPRFVLLTFADLKKYHFYYWFAFPALSAPGVQFLKAEAARPVGEALAEAVTAALDESDDGAENKKTAWVWRNRTGALVQELDGLQEGDALVYVDVCAHPQYAGWPLRNMLLHAKARNPELVSLSVLSVRPRRDAAGKVDLGASVLWEIQVRGQVQEGPVCVGWERNVAGKLGPRLVDLTPLMEPARLAETSATLNLRLLKWRAIPELDLEMLGATRCLLLGSGTLGCNVARQLLGWGVKRFTFLDNGKVSWSNPARQSLFGFEDAQAAKPKAEAAREGLLRILPTLEVDAVQLKIPMPGHPPDEGTFGDLARLEALVDAHDVIFLLTDSRESRWLPSLLGRRAGKLVINAALGMDTWMVMRHGVAGAGDAALPHLGCYFCNDIVAPVDSLKDRTLDQQCTVTRPGGSMLASAIAVELMVNVLHHPSSAGVEHLEDARAHPAFGTIPHQVRGSLHSFEMHAMSGRAFDRCTACSSAVLQRYEADRDAFVGAVLRDPKQLEAFSGLQELHQQTQRRTDESGWADSDGEAEEME